MFNTKYEAVIRLGCFAGVFLAMALWELLAPRRPLIVAKSRRWASNLGLVVIDTLAVRLLIPLGAMGAAVFANERGWGLFNNVAVSPWVAVAGSVILFDLVVYFQHVLFHAVPLLWRLHLVHHVDLDFDVTTGLRFHPVEILLSLGIKMAAATLIGPPALAILIFEVLLNATSMFNHGNAKLPIALDKFLRLIVVTPDMHRVHHSVHRRETNSNFGFCLPWWDRLFGTYRPQPTEGHDDMVIGLTSPRDERTVARLDRMLILPVFAPMDDDFDHAPRA